MRQQNTNNELIKFSLLQKNPEQMKQCGVIYDLSADKLVRVICPDVRKADYFLSELSKPLTTAENIIYRQEILNDFAAIPKLFDEMKLVFHRYDNVKRDWRELRTRAYPSGDTVNHRVLLEYTFDSLKATAIFPKTIISFYRSIEETLSKYDIKSEGLIKFKRYCGEMIGNNSLNEIASIAALFQYHSPENFDFGITAFLDETLKLKFCDLCDISEHKETKNSGGILGNIFNNLNKKKNMPDGFQPVPDSGGETVDDALYILNESLRHIDAALSRITNDVYEIFYGISSELQFYETALCFVNYLKERRLAFNFPKILACEADTFIAKDIYDPLLIAEGVTKQDLIVNSVSLGGTDGGILIKGLNKTAKTAYLRAIGLTQLLAQAGLPVPAESAEISIRNAVFSHFSAAEEDFKGGDTAGRFEGEVQLIAGIVNELVPYSLLLLNETFQTTAYGEGTEGIFNILSVLPCEKLKTKYIFVTRLNGLFDMMKDMNVIFIETGHDDGLYKTFDVSLRKK